MNPIVRSVRSFPTHVFHCRLCCSQFFRVPRNQFLVSKRSLSLEDKEEPFQKKIKYMQWSIFLGFTGVVVGGALFLSKDLAKEEKKAKQSFGHPSIGGDFNLVDHNGKACTLKNFQGKWALLYFGFCRCPDICPEQIERMVEITDRIDLIGNKKDAFVPVFITVDPERDTPEVVAEYVSDFSPRLIGLTGTKEEIGRAAKSYRIYFSAGPKDADGDYIVDHTVVFYLLDPNGQFSEYYGQTKPAADIANSILAKMKEYSD
ncbi:unnamed protein product [Calicophoron daubneyi]|uniref:Thioredoxin domain-containing protein n=1 Tax=Calicophoron daubneyi TaxID=300641 RepID=A0AAV2T1Q3_CALDB